MIYTRKLDLTSSRKIDVNDIYSSLSSKGATRLSQLHQPVSGLYWRGQDPLKLLSKITVAVVGSRHPSNYGEDVTRYLCKELVANDVVIVSGLALGIDSIAHQTAIDNKGQTIAVLPTGLDTIYPLRHQKLAKEIINSGGCLISEYPDNSGRPMKHQFIARNRIIAALADIILITEATERSGSLHTAYFGLELGSDILAVPGNIDSALSTGTNKLIQKGAIPVLSPSDILNCLQ